MKTVHIYVYDCNLIYLKNFNLKVKLLEIVILYWMYLIQVREGDEEK